jgi:hypothetical protein
MEGLKRYRYSTYSSMVTGEEYPSDQATLVLNLHLSTEYWLDRLLQKRCNLDEEELESFDLSYSKKLTVLRELTIVPVDILQNLKVLNELRNRFAHSLDYMLGDNVADFNFTSLEVDFDVHKRQAALRYPERRADWWKEALVAIGKATLKRLENYCVKDFGLSEPEDG